MRGGRSGFLLVENGAVAVFLQSRKLASSRSKLRPLTGRFAARTCPSIKPPITPPGSAAEAHPQPAHSWFGPASPPY